MKLIANITTALATVVVTGCLGPASSAQKPVLHLSSDAKSAPADGLAQIHFVAKLDNAFVATPVITFEVQGVGLLSATNALVANGQASVTLYAPTESELSAGAAQSKVIAHFVDGAAHADASASVTFTVPTQGAPLLAAHSTPDRVVAGGTDSITLIVEGRRLANASVSLTADSSAVSIPATLALTDPGDGLLQGQIVITPPADPVDVTVHVAADGATAVDVVLHFIAADAAAFDLTGTFAQVSYGVVSIGGLGPLLEPSTQCGVAPTFSLVQITQTGAHLSVATTVCQMNMPGVNVGFGQGPSTNSIGPGFVRAANARGPGPLAFDLANVGAHAPFHPPFSAYATPLIMGAHLNDPHEDLPTSESDPRVTDDDNDGFPGVTITNSSQGAQHVVSRTTTSEFNGSIDSSDSVTGATSSSTESNILNSSTPLSPTIMNFPSPFYARRVDGRNGAPDISARDGDASSVSCDDVIAYSAELMAANPAPDAATACQ